MHITRKSGKRRKPSVTIDRTTGRSHTKNKAEVFHAELMTSRHLPRRFLATVPLHGLRISRYRGESPSPLHQRDRNLTCTKLKLSKSSRSSPPILDREDHFGGTGRSYSQRSAVVGVSSVALRAGI